ncbi:hypothetical protein BD410DRAFT_437600 [Rickenella mellea]|uniref:Uncharacterized protein n=1 Tax=Rickenella mellea TaxID=50990 RepID=A0A4Y7PY32_9AGAM|nr:hypothetical protein BD410DRAFT_437600 [Rickenella mellea]
MSGSSTRVPAALHAELSEYSSLLRALRTSKTLDLASHLTQPSVASSSLGEDVYEDDEPEDGESEKPVEESPSRSATPATEGASKRNSTRKLAKKATDTWTRWPLLANDVHVPEFGLDEEIRLIASQTLRMLEDNIEELPDHAEDNLEEDSDAHLPESYVSALSAILASQLSRILATLSLHMPLAEKSLKTRLRPVTWEGVLNAVSATEIVSVETMQRLKQRLEAIYGPSKSQAIHRMEVVRAAKRKLEDAMFIPEHDILTFKGPIPPSRSKGKRRRKAKTNSLEPSTGKPKPTPSS